MSDPWCDWHWPSTESKTGQLCTERIAEGFVPDCPYNSIEEMGADKDYHCNYQSREDIATERPWEVEVGVDREGYKKITDSELDAALSGMLFGAGTYNYQALAWDGVGSVIEAMRELGFECQLMTWADGTNSAKFGRPWDVPYSSQWVEGAATAPRAVAMAALRMLGWQGVGE